MVINVIRNQYEPIQLILYPSVFKVIIQPIRKSTKLGNYLLPQLV